MESHLKPEPKPAVKEEKKAAPTLHVGNMVWFVPYCDGAENVAHLPAIVCKVNDDGSANLCVFSEEGRPVSHQTIPFAKDGDDLEGDYCCATNAEGKRPTKKHQSKR